MLTGDTKHTESLQISPFCMAINQLKNLFEVYTRAHTLLPLRYESEERRVVYIDFGLTLTVDQVRENITHNCKQLLNFPLRHMF